jgi:hypothetical protein
MTTIEAATAGSIAGGRQAVHTVYGGAHLFRADTAQRLGVLGLRALEEYAPTAEEFARPQPPRRSPRPFARVRTSSGARWSRTSIDFEDGYGHRSDAEEDGHAVSAARGDGARPGRRHAAAVLWHSHQVA